MKVSLLFVLYVGAINCDVKTGHGYGVNYDPPEIVINRPGYVYPIPPNPPVQFDEPSTPMNLYGPPIYRPNVTYPPFQDEIPQIVPTYLPPNIYPPLGSPGITDLRPPQFDPIPTDDTVIIPSSDYLPPPTLYGVPDRNIPIQFRVFNMSCLDTSTRRYFRSLIRTSQPLDVAPIIDNSLSECIVGSGELFRLDLDGSKMTQCGVRYCSNANNDRNNLCVTVRMPSVRGLRLPEDAVVTLQCRPQESVVAHTKKLRLKPQNIQGRNAATIASGGLQRNFDTQVTLYRRNSDSNDFTQVVTPGAMVYLGEELLLRAAVREGDGWKYSRMGAVIMHRTLPTTASSNTPQRSASQNSVTLVDNLGCRNLAMKAVCPEQPRQVNPLITTLPFRAFMFQGANSGDEIVLSVRMLGCLQYEDCYQARTCDDKVQTRTRIKRGATNVETRNNMTDWQSYLEFKVVIADFQDTKKPEKGFLRNTNPFVMSTFIVGVLGSIICAVYVLRRK